jgi:phosphoserine phosphatase
MTEAPSNLFTPESFARSVAELAPRITVFDCDGTLWAPDSGSAFMHWSIRTGLLSREATEWLNQRYALYLAGEVGELAICGEMVQVYEGLREADLRAAVAEFFPAEIAPSIFPDMERVVGSLVEQGVEIWAVSSTNKWVVEEGVRRFGIPAERVLAACVAVEAGVVTRRVLDVPTDQGKVDSLGRRGVTAPDAVFGNSIHDAAMLAIARQAYPVNPSPALAARSAERGWPVFFPAVGL